MQDASPPRFEAMTAGMVLDQAIRLYARNFPLLVGIVALAYIPYYFFLGLVTWALQSDPDSIGFVLMVVLGFLLVVMLMWLIVMPLSTGATSLAVSEKYLQRPVSVVSAYRFALKRFWPVLVSQFVVGLAVMAGAMACLVPGIFLWLCWSVVVPVVMLEQKSAFDSMQRSWELTEGFRWKILGVAVVIFILSLALVLGANGLAVLSLALLGNPGSFLEQLITQGFTDGASLLTAPLLPLVVVLLYYDLRIRKEGFDLVMLHQTIHGEGLDLSHTPESSRLDIP